MLWIFVSGAVGKIHPVYRHRIGGRQQLLEDFFRNLEPFSVACGGPLGWQIQTQKRPFIHI